MEHQQEQDKRSADTLMILCPVCSADSGETLGVTGYSDGRLASSVIMQCDQCATIYLSPSPNAEDGTDGDARSPVYDGAIRNQKRRIPANTRFLSVEEPEELTFRRRADKGMFDLILLPLTIESAIDPAALLKHVASLLDAGGRVEVVVGNADSSSCSFYKGRHWFAYRFPQTRQLFGAQGMKALAEEAGLRVATQSSVFSANAWLQSARNWLKDWGFNSIVVSLATGRWLVPWLIAASFESVALLRNKASVLVVSLEKV